MKEWKFIRKETQDRVVAEWLKTISHMDTLRCPDMDELADALEVIGRRIRAESPGRGLLMFAKVIMDVAARRDC